MYSSKKIDCEIIMAASFGVKGVPNLALEEGQKLSEVGALSARSVGER